VGVRLPGHGPGDLIDVEFEGDTITLIEPAGVTRPLRLTVDEALALVVALRALAETPGLVERDAVDRALAKVEQAAGAAAGAAHRVEVSVEGETRVVPVVRAALDQGRVLHLSYYVPARDETTERDVDPLRLLLVEGRTYLEAWCRRAEGVRLFRLDRVAEVALLDEPSAPPADVEQRDVSQGLFRPGPDDLLVTLALQPAAAWVADYHPCESVEPQADGSLVVTLRPPTRPGSGASRCGWGSRARCCGPPSSPRRSAPTPPRRSPPTRGLAHPLTGLALTGLAREVKTRRAAADPGDVAVGAARRRGTVMTTIKASCPMCGEVELTPAEVWLMVCSHAPLSYYAFRCTSCHDEVRKPADDHVVSLLVSGRRARRRSGSCRAEALEEHTGPRLSYDDLLDFALRSAAPTCWRRPPAPASAPDAAGPGYGRAVTWILLDVAIAVAAPGRAGRPGARAVAQGQGAVEHGGAAGETLAQATDRLAAAQARASRRPRDRRPLDRHLADTSKHGRSGRRGVA
jgi:proteasome accessory factor C